jgi:hypothetical protein
MYLLAIVVVKTNRRNVRFLLWTPAKIPQKLWVTAEQKNVFFKDFISVIRENIFDVCVP